MRHGTPGFVGARLRKGREARGMSAATLAEVVGVSRAAISQYEYGRQSPSPETMKKIAQSLNLPLQWFLQPSQEVESGSVFYRCLSTATKAARTRAERRFEWLKSIVAFVQQYVKMPPPQFPEFDILSDPRHLDEAAIEELAAETRRFWGLKNGPIGNMVWLLENRGAIVARFDLLASTLDAFSEIDLATGRRYVVLGADKASAARSRFDAAHELAHLVLHRNVKKTAINQNDAHGIMEDQAHHFATAFLLPPDSFSHEFVAPSLDAFRTMKERWRVSIGAMVVRARRLDLINDDQLRNLRVNIGRRRWRTKEPLDDTLEPERPRFLRKCIELLVRKRITSAAEMPFLLGLPAADIEQLAGLDPGFLSTAESPVELADEHTADEQSDEGMIFKLPFNRAAQ